MIFLHHQVKWSYVCLNKNENNHTVLQVYQNRPQYFLKEKKKKKSWYNIFQGFFSAKICTCIKSFCFIIKQVTMTCKLKTGNFNV